MDNQHKKISGYRDLSQWEIDAINEFKKMGNEFEKLFENLANVDSVDKRWLAIAKTDLQKGIMALVRSIAKPEGF